MFPLVLKALRTQNSLPEPNPPDSPQSAPCQCLVHQSAPCQCLVHQSAPCQCLVHQSAPCQCLVHRTVVSLLLAEHDRVPSRPRITCCRHSSNTHHKIELTVDLVSVQSQCKRNAACFQTGLKREHGNGRLKCQTAAAEIEYVFMGHHCNVRCE